MPVHDPLSSAFAKRDRALELLDGLNRVASEFFASHEKVIVVERAPDGLTDRVYWNVADPPPTRIAVLAGDALSNLRASLDHLVFGLSTTSPSGFPQREHRSVAFPVCRSEATWSKDATQRKLAHLIRGARLEIESLQPFKRTDRPLLPYPDQTPIDTVEYHPLAVLDRWANIDKHRTLHTAYVNAYGAFLGEPTPHARIEMAYPDIVEAGTEICRIVYTREPELPPEEVSILLPGDLRIQESPSTWGISRSIGDIATFVTVRVLDRFRAIL